MRCIHEASYHERNSFLTLTYRDENLPSNTGQFPSLIPRHMTLFIKRLRYHYGKLRELYCGEYGETTGRPHYHMLAFGFEPPDKVLHSVNQRGDKLYTSKFLDDVWGLGNCLVGDLTAASAGYTCRYTIKKQMDGHQHYLDRGQYPPFIRMSRNPGIGRQFYADFGQHLISLGFITDSEGSIKPIPPYYKKLFRNTNPLESQLISTAKALDAISKELISPDARSKILSGRTSSLKRGL